MRPFQLGLALSAGLIFSGLAALAWTGPSAAPPNGNVSAPINVGSTVQTRTGPLAITSNLQLAGVGGSYLNFGASAGSGGYGIRDNAGALEFKNTGGTWYDMNTVVSNYLTLNNINFLSGNVGISAASPAYKLDVNGVIRSNNEIISTLGAGSGQVRMIAGNYGAMWRNDGVNLYLLFTNSGNQYGTWNALRPVSFNLTTGDATFGTNVYAAGYFHSSDKNLKANIATSSGIDLVEKLRGVTFDWKKDGTPSAGVIAQEVEKVMPSAVHTDANGMKSVDYDQIIAPLIEAVKTQEQKIEAQGQENETQRTEIQQLQKDIESLRAEVAR